MDLVPSPPQPSIISREAPRPEGCGRPILKYSRLGGPSIPCFLKSRPILSGDDSVGSLRSASPETDAGGRSAEKASDFDRRR